MFAGNSGEGAKHFFLGPKFPPSNSQSVGRSPVNFPQEDKVFQRPCHSVLLPSYFFATTVGNEYDRSVFNMTGSLGHNLSGLVAGDSAICGRLAALILRLRPAGLRFEEFRSPVKRGGLGLRFSNRGGLRPAAILRP